MIIISTENEYREIIECVKEIELLKNKTRTAWGTSGRRESVAEHSWRLAVFALVMQDKLISMDKGKIIEMCLIHDFGEAYDGDIPATKAVNHEEKLEMEERAVKKLLEPLKESVKNKIFSLWQEYNEGITEEAKFVKALDKIETIVQHNQGKNPENFDYDFNLTYGKSLADKSPVLEIIRKIVDEETEKKIYENEKKQEK